MERCRHPSPTDLEHSWTRPQVLARAHPNVLAATTWLNSLYHVDDSGSNVLDGVDLSTPLTYADRFRIRHAGNLWKEHPPHIDGMPLLRKKVIRAHSSHHRGSHRTLGRPFLPLVLRVNLEWVMARTRPIRLERSTASQDVDVRETQSGAHA